MSDLFKPLRDRLRQLGWRQLQRWKLSYWQRPDGAEFDEAEALTQLARIDQDGSKGIEGKES